MIDDDDAGTCLAKKRTKDARDPSPALCWREHQTRGLS